MAQPQRIVSWNAHVGRDNDDVMRDVSAIIGDLDPDALCFQEFGKYAQAAVKEFGVKHGGHWRVYQHDDWEESDFDIVMVHERYDPPADRGEKHGWNTLRCTTDWIGPEGARHPGRTWTWVYVNGIYLMSLHRCTSGKKKNKKAFEEEYHKIRDWMDNHDDAPALIIGDHNIGPKDTYKWGSWQIADKQNAATRYDTDDPGIDYAISRQAKPKKVNRTKTYGSDHKALLYVRE